MPCMIRGGGIFGEKDGGDLLQISKYQSIPNFAAFESPQALRASSLSREAFVRAYVKLHQ